MKPTQGELRVGRGDNLLAYRRILRDSQGNLIASASGTNTVPIEQQEANAAEIAKRWNAFEPMRDALKDALRIMDWDNTNKDTCPCKGCSLYRKIVAALALAEKGEPK